MAGEGWIFKGAEMARGYGPGQIVSGGGLFYLARAFAVPPIQGPRSMR